MFMMLDSLKAEDLSTRRAGEAWMRCSLKSYLRFVPPPSLSHSSDDSTPGFLTLSCSPSSTQLSSSILATSQSPASSSLSSPTSTRSIKLACTTSWTTSSAWRGSAVKASSASPRDLSSSTRSTERSETEFELVSRLPRMASPQLTFLAAELETHTYLDGLISVLVGFVPCSCASASVRD